MLGPLQQVELDESGDRAEVGVTAQPDLFELLLSAFLHAETVHGNEHLASPGLDRTQVMGTLTAAGNVAASSRCNPDDSLNVAGDIKDGLDNGARRNGKRM